MNEIWKDVPGYEGLYQVSSLGRVKSLSRLKTNGKSTHISKDLIMSPNKNRDGYLCLLLRINNKSKTKKVHQLVAMAFLNHKPDGTHKIVVDHINHDKLDNRVENLQVITNRENCSKDVKNKSSKYTGVCWDKSRSKWASRIKINGKNHYLGRFNCEEEANQVYQNKLKTI
jgi:hypothetical protein